MPEEITGNIIGTEKSFAIVVSRFNELISASLLRGAVDTLTRHGVDEEDITIVWTPGAFDIPLVAKILAESGKHNAIIALGCVIRGATAHFEYVAGEAASGISQVSMQTGVPVLFGILTTDTIEQAIERAGTKSGNKGADAAMAAIEMACLIERISVSRP